MNNVQIPIQMLQMLKGGNAQQMVMNILQQKAGNNPVIQNVVQLANNKDYSGLETVTRNLCASRGIDPNQLVSQIQKQLN